ncbi:MAG: hypothetical protein QME50_04005 [Candidatus Bathyarchaeota archaeon]|nr:hypothetical protein [Candidatus Bathyarchaeota archaeon]
MNVWDNGRQLLERPPRRQDLSEDESETPHAIDENNQGNYP